MSLKTTGELNPPNRLLIFDEFQVDENLPKFAQQRAAQDDEAKMEGGSVIHYSKSRARFLVGRSEFTEVTVAPPAKKPSWWRRWFTKRPKPEQVISVKYVFDLVLTNPEELTLLRERDAAFQELIDRATAAGQTSLIKQLESEREIRKFESTLFAKGMKRYISEPQLLKFVQGCERGLCLDWIQHFTRMIPQGVVDAKVKCDEAGLFDNYCVLHFDPDEKATTQADRDAATAKRKDPILFGVMRGSRKLYFVGDWTDELCDLTIQQVVDKLGAEERTELK
jgi:hypothetical protein